MTGASTMPGFAKYNRTPTRARLHLLWIFVFGTGFTYEMFKLTIHRVGPRRNEEIYMKLKDKYGEDVPEHILDESQQIREFREAATLSNVLATPTPGEVNGALQWDFDYRRIAQLKK